MITHIAPTDRQWRPALAPQLQMWLLHQLDPRRADNFVPLALRYEGVMPPHVLRQALGEIVRRHAVLRWQFRTTRDGVEFIERPWSPPAVAIADLARSGAGRRGMTAIVHAFITRPFSLDAYPLFRVLHVRLGPREGLVFGVFHHSIADGWSMAVLGAELEALWARLRQGLATELPALDIQYAELWDPSRAPRRRGSPERSLAFWQHALRDLDDTAAWPWPRRKRRSTRQAVRRRSDHMASADAATLRSEAARRRASPFLFFTTVFSVLRWRLSGCGSFLVGTDAAGRTDERAERLIGFFVNVLPLRVEIDPRGRFMDLLEAVRRQFLAAYDHQDVSYEALLRSVAPARGAGRNPLFNVKLMMHNFLDHRLQLPDLTLAAVPVALGDSSEDLKLFIRPIDGGYVFDWEARGDAFSEAELAALADLFQDVTRQVLASPDVLARDLILPIRGWRSAKGAAAPDPAAPEASAPEVSESEVRASETRRDPLVFAAEDADTAVLIDGPGGRVEAADFARRIATIAAALRAGGLAPGEVAALSLSPSIDAAICAAAVLSAGAAFVSIDPGDTPDVIRRSLDATRPSFVVIGDDASAAAAVSAFAAGTLATRIVRLGDLRSWTASASSGSTGEHLAAAGDLAFVDVHVADDGAARVYRFTRATLAAQMEAWLAVWRHEPGACVVNSDPADVISLLADLRLCLDQRRTLILRNLSGEIPGGLTGRAGSAAVAAPPGGCGYVRIQASALAGEPRLSRALSLLRTLQSAPAGAARGDGAARGINVVIEGRITPTACAAASRALSHARLHVFTRVPGVPLAASHVEWRDTFASACRMPAGQRFGNCELHVLDVWLQPLPATGAGEIYVSGDIAASVDGGAVRMTDPFVMDPCSRGARLLATGLWGARLDDGQIMVVGTPRRLSSGPGRMCDTARVECLLLEHPAVEDALIVRVAGTDPPAIAAFVTLVGGPAGDPARREQELWTLLSGRLTRAAMPDAIHVVPALPLDRRGRLVIAQLTPQAPSAAPPHPPLQTQTAIVPDLAGLWRELLRVEREIGKDEDFFELGGDSLLATRMAFRLEEQYGVEIGVGDIFASRTLSRLSERIAEASAAAAPAATLARVDRSGLLPLASAQNRLLFLHDLDPSGCAYHCPVEIELRGRPGLSLIAQSFATLVERQEAFRTTFLTLAGELRQRVLPRVNTTPPLIDLRGVPHARREALARRIRRAALPRPMRLAETPAFRIMVLERGDGVCELSLTMHHLISDAWSERIVVRELSAIAARYAAGHPADLPPLPFQYGDYACWQQQRLQGSHLARLMERWSALAGAADLEPIALAAKASADGARRAGYRRFAVPEPLRRTLEAVGRSRGATLYVLVLAAFQMLMHRLTAKPHVTFIVSAANRYPREMADVVGFFANTFPVASTWSADDTAFTLLERTREYLAEALRLQELPFDRIVDALRRSRPDVDPSRLNVSFVMTPAADEGLAIPGSAIRSLVMDDAEAKFDLELQLNAGVDGLAGVLEYSTAFLSDEAAGALVSEYLALLERIVTPEAPRAARVMAGARRPVPLSRQARAAAPAPDRETWQPDGAFPALFAIAPDTTRGWEAWYAGRREELTAAVKTHGALVFRNTPISNVEEFRRFTQALTPNLMPYMERSSPRRDLGAQVYTSTEYPAAERIFLHNECAYSRTWPRSLFFYCHRPAATGGETILCDSRKVYERLSRDLTRRFERLGVTYARHYSGFLDLPWQVAFQTEDRGEVERYCEEAGITWHWTDAGGLKTRQRGPATLRHPDTGDPVWFNQAHMFHISALKDEYRTALLSMFDEADVPRHAYMGDGSPITAADLDEIRAVYESLQCDVRLERGDVIWLDNVRCAHGRRPFTGEREVAVIMTEPMRLAE